MSPLIKSQNPDATCHRKRHALNDKMGFLQRKFYLGDDTLMKLALIFKALMGKKLDLERMDSESAADVISSCINLMYNTLFFDCATQKKTIRKGPPAITPAISPKAFKKYRLYQQVRGRFNKLQTGDTDTEKYESVANFLNENGIIKPSYHKLSNDKKWLSSDVEKITAELINELIAKDNEKFKAKNTSLANADV
ncbi:hypothetical protein JGX82_001977 [Salmonella enterica]|uniref:Uncharacterized protein n=1 Tax=Salmonella enterica TaxID=28901 RepID=A0A5V0QEL0_SALER|nr:hypothetical protein [Salmonella enterica]EAN3289413.1 hypothetical protein [Salmonella enterica subsp. enterica serovar Oranienburg]ECB7205699.1 hypothetical protein [Salmonella enterica subsp. enterica serovar Abaetetuba]ECC9950291.1 hypothetical protein [Salmonella enterica subsp. enterica]EDI2723084.1 hypothetical protein [Salmonella enterica subsp. enterica serovar Rubislaw]EDL1779326.1 hypothetical protein [Salmonella enterica subsp. enterica serovar Poona]EDU7668665.1 hypothetical p